MAVDVKELREKAKGKFAEAKKFADEHGMNDENADPSEADVAAVTAILEDAKKLDAEYAKASGLAGIRTSIGERMDYYSKAVLGRSAGIHPIYSESRKVSLGRQFVDSESYQELLKSGRLKSEHASFKVDPVTFAAGDLVDPGTGGAQDGLVLPQFLPGILPLPQRPLTIRELFGEGTTESDTISYAAQVSFESASAPVAKSLDASGTNAATGVKPQSSFTWERRTSPVETMATFMATTRQGLADAGQMQSIIDNQGRMMLQMLEEDQMIDGTGTVPALKGLLHTNGVQTLDLTGLAEAAQLDGIRVARRLIKTGLSRLSADAIVLNPSDSEAFDLMKDLNGQYRGGNPVGNFNYDQPLWGLRRVESEAVAEGTGIVGAFKAGASVLERQGITVYSTDSHADFFVKNLIAILFEERFGFPVFYPSAFVAITFDNLSTIASGNVGVQSGA